MPPIHTPTGHTSANLSLLPEHFLPLMIQQNVKFSPRHLHFSVHLRYTAVVSVPALSSQISTSRMTQTSTPMTMNVLLWLPPPYPHALQRLVRATLSCALINTINDSSSEYIVTIILIFANPITVAVDVNIVHVLTGHISSFGTFKNSISTIFKHCSLTTSQQLLFTKNVRNIVVMDPWCLAILLLRQSSTSKHVVGHFFQTPCLSADVMFVQLVGTGTQPACWNVVISLNGSTTASQNSISLSLSTSSLYPASLLCVATHTLTRHLLQSKHHLRSLICSGRC